MEDLTCLLATVRTLKETLITRGGTQLFSGRGVRPGFPKCGACELILASEKGACELKIPKFGGLWTENFQMWGLWVPGGGHWPRKGIWGCAALKTPFSRLSCHSQGSHLKQKSQFTRPLLRKFGNFSLNSLNFHPYFSSQAPNLEIFNSQAPKFGNFQLTSP